GNLKYARRNEHLFNIIEGLRKDYHLAVVTTASKKNVTDILTFFGVQDLFEFIITQEDITRPKPDPEGFLKAMNHFGINPENTVIFEDADVGIEAAKRSGAAVFKVEKF
nr:HAD family hydrolase [Lachnospiraceae bacterium]